MHLILLLISFTFGGVLGSVTDTYVRISIYQKYFQLKFITQTCNRYVETSCNGINVEMKFKYGDVEKSIYRFTGGAAEVKFKTETDFITGVHVKSDVSIL